MIIMIKYCVAGLLWLAVMGSYCGAGAHEPIKRFVDELECNVTIQAADSIAAENGLPPSSPTQQPLVGDRSIKTDEFEIGFTVQDDTLVEYRVIQYGLKAARSTPRQNLCTAELSFDLVLNVPASLVGSSVDVDGSEVTKIHERFGTTVQLPSGSHTVMIRHPEFQPISRHFDLSSSSEGVPRVTISESEIRVR
jgi:hypothetical protein